MRQVKDLTQLKLTDLWKEVKTEDEWWGDNNVDALLTDIHNFDYRLLYRMSPQAVTLPVIFFVPASIFLHSA
jgi:hypothetical protein